VRVYTKRGDTGQTDLVGGQRVDKDDLRVIAYGDVDELGAVLGLFRAGPVDGDLAERILRIQEELLALEALLATPEPSASGPVPALPDTWVLRLETEIDEASASLPALREFLVPGGAPAAALLHLGRTVCRRAERSVVALSRRDAVVPGALAYLNRLSDWLFVMARLANQRAGEPERPWRAPARS